MEFKTIQFQKSKFYNEKEFQSEPTTIGKDFKIKLHWHSSIDNELKLKVQTAAQNLCGIIKTDITHSIGIVQTPFNQASVELVLMPSYSKFKDTYSQNIHNETQKSVLGNNLNLSEEQCDGVFYYSLAQMQAFGFDSKKINSYIGLSKNPTLKEITELLLNTLGRLPSFHLKKAKLSYISLLSLCTYKSPNARTNSSEYGSYLSIDNGINSIGFLTDDDSLEFLNEESNLLIVLDALGYTTHFDYLEHKFQWFQNEDIVPLHNSLVNFPFKKNFKVFPSLPKGLELCSGTGTIRGTPIVSQPKTIYLIIMNEKKECLIEIQIKTKEPPITFGSCLMTAAVVLILLLLIFASIAIGYKAYH